MVCSPIVSEIWHYRICEMTAINILVSGRETQIMHHLFIVALAQ